MNAFLYGSLLQWKLDMRFKEVLVIYYTVPLAFFLFMGGVFTSIMPEAYKTLIQSMTVFGTAMGAIVGSPVPLCALYGSEIKKAYRVGNIPLWTVAVSNFISAFIHLTIVSIIIFFMAPIAFKAEIPNNLAVYFISLALMLVANICIGTLFGLFVKSTSKLTMISQLVFLPSIMLSGIMFPVEMLPRTFQYIGKLFPSTWGYQMMCKDIIIFADMVPLLAIIIIATIVCAIKLSKMQNE